MARRMFNDSVVRSDLFLKLPHSSQILYFQLMMDTDDYGFVDNPQMVMIISRAKEVDLKRLERNGYIYKLNPGLILVRHFRAQNTIRADRIKESRFAEQLKKFQLDEAGTYEKSEQIPLL